MRRTQLWFTLILVFAIASACYTPLRLIQADDPKPTPTDQPEEIKVLPTATDPMPTEPAATPTLTANPSITPTPTDEVATQTPSLEPFASSGEVCAFHPAVAAMLEDTSADQWRGWLEMLSGAQPVTVAGEETRIETRYSPSLFNGAENARAFDWLLEQVQQWYPDDQIEVQPFRMKFEDQVVTWKNLIVTIPGRTRPDEIVILSAHLDSTSETPTEAAPGAADNGSGSATLIEAARLFRDAAFERTLQIIWFTGEEQGLHGSQAFLEETDPQAIEGVVNLDMFGYDSDDDRCFELHVGTLPESQPIGKCFVDSIEAYDLDLTYDYVRQGAIGASDHGSFWREGVGAIEVLEDLFEHNQPRGCPASDPNPHYHTTNDVVEHLNIETAYRIARASIATAAGMAVPLKP